MARGPPRGALPAAALVVALALAVAPPAATRRSAHLSTLGGADAGDLLGGVGHGAGVGRGGFVEEAAHLWCSVERVGRGVAGIPMRGSRGRGQMRLAKETGANLERRS